MGAQPWRWLAALGLLAGLAAPAAAQTVMRINISIGQNSHQGVAIDAFAKEVAQRTGGRYVIETYCAGSLGGERESIESVQLGTQALTFTATGPVPNFVPEARILDIPFLFCSKATPGPCWTGPSARRCSASTRPRVSRPCPGARTACAT